MLSIPLLQVCKILKRDIESLIQKGLPKNSWQSEGATLVPAEGIVGRRQVDKGGRPPIKPKKGTLNMIIGGFDFGGETNSSREFYATQISRTTRLGTAPEWRTKWSSSSWRKIWGTYPACTRVLIESGSSTHVLLLNALKNMGKSERDLLKVIFPLMGVASTATYLVGDIIPPIFLGEW